MEGRYSPGTLFVLSRCKEPAREGEWNEWYNATHVADACEPGLVRNPVRYRITGSHLSVNLGDGQYLAIYETDEDDLEGILRSQVAHQDEMIRSGRLHPAMETTLATMYRRIGPEFQTSSAHKGVRGLKVIMTECVDSSKVREFHDWYNNTHVPDILNTGLFHTAYRFEVATPIGTPEMPLAGGGKFLALYETDSDDPARNADEILSRWHPIWETQGRLTDLLRLVGRGVFHKIWPG